MQKAGNRIARFIASALFWPLVGLSAEYHVNGEAGHASDENAGGADAPFRTISRAASVARAGDTILVHPGIYREWVSPRNGGTQVAPITYRATEPGKVVIKGSDRFTSWERDSANSRIIRISLAQHAFEDGNPFDIPLLAAETRATHAREAGCLGQVFVQGRMYAERGLPWKNIYRHVELRVGKAFIDPSYDPLNRPGIPADFGSEPGTWAYDNATKTVHIALLDEAVRVQPEDLLVELTVRKAVFAPRHYGTTPYIQVKGFVMEHSANQFPLEFWQNPWARQTGVLSCGGSPYWVIEGNTVRYGSAIGIHCGSAGALPEDTAYRPEFSGGHVLRDNEVYGNGSCGIAGYGAAELEVVGNLIHHNNVWGFTAHENGGMKFHGFVNGRIEGNFIWANQGHGIWLDNGWKGARVTRNVCLENGISAVFCEIDFGPALVDHNILWGSKGGGGHGRKPTGYGVFLAETRQVQVSFNLMGGHAAAAIHGRGAESRNKRDVETGEMEVVGLQDNLLVNNVIFGTVPFSLPPAGPFIRDNRVAGNLAASVDRSTGESLQLDFDRRAMTMRVSGYSVPSAQPFDHPLSALLDGRDFFGEASSADLRVGPVQNVGHAFDIDLAAHLSPALRQRLKELLESDLGQ